MVCIGRIAPRNKVSNAVNKSTFAMAGTNRAEIGPCQWKMASCRGDASKIRTLAKAAVDAPKQATARDIGFRSEINAFKVPVFGSNKSQWGNKIVALHQTARKKQSSANLERCSAD